MRELGAPTIRAILVGEVLYAIDGSHRLAAAHALGIDPVIDIVADRHTSGRRRVADLDIHGLGVAATVAELRVYFAGQDGDRGNSYSVTVSR
jgi:ParB-like chromosome segregation protein Spo0J